MIKKLNRILQFHKGLNPQQLYYKVIGQLYKDYGIDRANKSMTEVLEYLSGEKSVKDNDITRVKGIITEVYSNNIENTFKSTLEIENKKLYNYRRTAMKKAETDFDKDDILGIDQRTIDSLTNSDLVWIYNHANNTLLSYYVSQEMAWAKAQGMTMSETAEHLMSVTNFKLPARFNDNFGDERRWLNKRYKYYKMVVQISSYRAKSYANINNRRYLGVKGYKIFPRPGACEICIEASTHVYCNEDAIKRMEDYEKYSKDGDVEKMKEADPFWTLEDVKNGGVGVIIPLHPYCACEDDDVLECPQL